MTQKAIFITLFIIQAATLLDLIEAYDIRDIDFAEWLKLTTCALVLAVFAKCSIKVKFGDKQIP